MTALNGICVLETVDIVLKAWTNEKLSYEGKYYRYDGGMSYLMAAPLSRRSFAMLTDKVLPQIAG